MKSIRMKAAIGLTSAIALAAPTAAGAQPSVEGYSEQEVVGVQGADEGSGPSDPSGSVSGDQAGSGSGDQAGSGSGDQAGSGSGDQAGSASATLPFTGIDLALLAGGGVLLVGTGFGMRRLTRSPEAR